jgi:hypothetical protein
MAEQRRRPGGFGRAAAALLAVALLATGAPAVGQRAMPRPAPVRPEPYRPHGDARPAAGEPTGEAPTRIEDLEGWLRTVPAWDRAHARQQWLVEAARRHYRADPADFQRPVQFRDDLPFFRLRLPRSRTEFDAAILADARQRYEAALAAPLTIDRISVIDTDFSPRGDVQRDAARVYRDRIPAARRRPDAALRRLRGDIATPSPTLDAIERVLTPYRGQVLILVGHVDGDGTMSWSRPGGMVFIDLDLWALAADRVGAVLLPIGCYSSLAAPVGTPSAVNSSVLLGRVAAMLAARPADFAGLFGGLTEGGALILDFDPFQARLGYEKIDIVRDGGAEGAILWNPDLFDPLRLGDMFDPRGCGGSRNMSEYRRCAEQERAASAAGDSAHQAEAERQVNGPIARRFWIGAVLFFGMIFVAALPLASARRSPGPEAPAGFARGYRQACAELGLLHGAGVALLLPGGTLPALVAGLGLIATAGTGLTLLVRGMDRDSIRDQRTGAALLISAAAYFMLLLPGW